MHLKYLHQFLGFDLFRDLLFVFVINHY